MFMMFKLVVVYFVSVKPQHMRTILLSYLSIYIIIIIPISRVKIWT